MSRILSDEFVTELNSKLISCGLSPKQVESYVGFCCRQFQQDEQNNLWEMFPSDKCLNTLAEAQRVISSTATSKLVSHELSDFDIYQFLQIPCEEWQSAKAEIAECFDRSEAEVDTMYCDDEAWLFVTADSVSALADYLKSVFPDADLAWKVFQKAALLGAEKSKERIAAVLNMLGEEIGHKVIRTDINDSGWLFYRFYTDPVGCIDYLKKCGLTPERVLDIIEHDSYILYMYKEGCRPKYNHDQERIDILIQRYTK